MKGFVRQTSKETIIAALLLLLLPALSAAVRVLDPTSGMGFDWLSVLDTTLQVWRIYVACIVGWGLNRLLFPTLADHAAQGGFSASFALLSKIGTNGDSAEIAIIREAAWRRCKLTAAAAAFSYGVALAAILLF